MKLIFFDESKPQRDFPRYHIGAVCIDKEHLREIEESINQISEEIFGVVKLSRASEFHANNIYNKQDNFRNVTDENRLEIFTKFLKILSQENIDLIDIQINTDKLALTQDSAKIAFMYLCERANQHIKVNHSLGMLIGDRENDGVSERFSLALSDYRIAGTQFQYGQKLDHIFESVHFTHSHLSRFLQLADIYTWFLRTSEKYRLNSSAKLKPFIELRRQDGINLFPRKYKEWPK